MSSTKQDQKGHPSLSLADVANQVKGADTSSDDLPKSINQKRMREKTKRELDIIIQGWIGNSDGIIVIDNEGNKVSFQESYPSGREEIEGSNCGRQCMSEYQKTQIKPASTSEDKSCQHFSMKADAKNTEELEFAAELCNKVGNVLKSAKDPMKSEINRNSSMEEGISEEVYNVQKCKEKSEASERSMEEDSGSALLGVMEKSLIKGDIVAQTVSVQGDDSISFTLDRTGQNYHLCYVCRKHYKTLSHLSRHIKAAHSNQQVHECNICNTSFTRTESLIRHLKMHEKKRETNKTSTQGPFKCPKCHKTYQQAYNVTRHLLSHTGEKPFKCTECNKTFTQYTGLSRHLVLHKGSKDFKCKVCGKMFARLFVLNRHMLTHTDDKPYKCFVCSKSFIRASQLSGHMHSHQKKAKIKNQDCDHSGLDQNPATDCSSSSSNRNDSDDENNLELEV